MSCLVNRLLLAEGKAVQKKLDQVRLGFWGARASTTRHCVWQGACVDDEGLAVYDKLVALRQRTQTKLHVMRGFG